MSLRTSGCPVGRHKGVALESDGPGTVSEPCSAVTLGKGVEELEVCGAGRPVQCWSAAGSCRVMLLMD